MSKYGHPGSSGIAQSGGINRTFGGGKGGTANSRSATYGRKIGKGRNVAGLSYNVRSSGGDAAITGLRGGAGSPPPLRGGAKPNGRVKIHPPIRKGDR